MSRSLIVVATILVGLLGAGFVATPSEAEEPLPLERIDPDMAVKQADDDMRWYDALVIGLEGQAWTDTEHPYDRLPARAKGRVTDAVWGLSHDSAGMAVRFMTDSDRVAARWTLRDAGLAMSHMPATGVSGLDLYVRTPEGWRWVAVGRPVKQTSQVLLVEGIPEGMKEYLMFLPLYNGVDKLEIGVDPGSTVAKAPPRAEKNVVVYGTSIVQGGCAARPGMAYPAILGRWLDREFINLGFSGNGRMEIEMEELIAELDPAVYIIDTVPNMSAEIVEERAYNFLTALRRDKPDTPIVLVECVTYQQGWFVKARGESYQSRNAAWRAVYQQLLADGVKGLHYLPTDDLLGSDGEATVDGTHPTDVGFMRQAESLEPILRGILERK